MRMDEELNTVVPDNPNKPYDMRDVVHLIVDNGEFFEVQEHFARNIVVGFSRLNGRPIGSRCRSIRWCRPIRISPMT